MRLYCATLLGLTGSGRCVGSRDQEDNGNISDRNSHFTMFQTSSFLLQVGNRELASNLRPTRVHRGTWRVCGTAASPGETWRDLHGMPDACALVPEDLGHAPGPCRPSCSTSGGAAENFRPHVMQSPSGGKEMIGPQLPVPGKCLVVPVSQRCPGKQRWLSHPDCP